MRSAFARVPPVVVLLIALICGVLAGRYWMAPVPAQTVALVLTALVFLVGLLLILGAGLQFRRHQTPIHPHAQPRRLVRQGPFRFSRNPVYLGMLLWSGLPYVWTGQPAALVSSLLFFLYMNMVTIPVEEARLRLAFPDEFREYARQVRRWL